MGQTGVEYRFPKTWVRQLLLGLLRVVYRLRIHGLENLPRQGPAILVANHSTWLDGYVLLVMVPRRLRMIAWAGNFTNALMRWLANFSSTILITSGPKSIRRGFETARKALEKGELVGMFPEGGLSRTGQIQALRPGIMKIMDELDGNVPIVPIYLDQMWGSIFSYADGRMIWKIPKSWRRPMTIHIGRPLQNVTSIHQVRQALTALSAEAAMNRQPPFRTPAQMVLRQLKSRKFKPKLFDSMGEKATGGMALTKALVLRRLLRKHVLDDDERNVGILIPPTVGSALVNLAVALDRRVAVNLNYTLSPESIEHCIEQAKLKHVLTSKRVMEKLNLKLEKGVYYLEDLKDKVSRADKLFSMLESFLMPAGWLERKLGLHKQQPDDLVTIVFTSGSTGTPKGVMLTQRNIATNVEAIDQVIRLNPSDMLAGILPFFHSFGYTVTLWGGLGLNVGVVYHVNPLEASQVGKLVEKHGCTVLLATPTFLRSYLKRCSPQQFKTLDVVVAGAERLPTELCDAFEAKFGVRPVEGYGCTELSPLVSVNIPPSRRGDNFQVDAKEGTVGRPIPNVAAKVTDLDSGQELEANEDGMLWISGPNVMKGYLDRKDLTDEVIEDGWYKTGDVALVDDDGFIKITGRLNRFSKIGGEMVPHVKIEEALNACLDAKDQEEPQLAVTSVPDERKGEKLVVLYTQLSKSPDELCRELKEKGLPNLFIPSPDAFLKVDELPILGSGKLDLKALPKLAAEHMKAVHK